MKIKPLILKLKANLQIYFKKLLAFIKAKITRYQLVRWIIVILLTLILISVTYLTYVAKTADVKGLESKLEKTTEIYDSSGEKAGYLYSQKGTWIPLSSISKNVQDAVISMEDRNFYKEHGYSVRGFGRAFLLYLKNLVFRKSQIDGGGSTLTQQLVKNAFLSQQQTFSRKLKEVFISIQVENTYSKKQILTMYLNNAYFGNGVWGIEDASLKYFGVHATDISIPQAAVLAGMLSNPEQNNPINHPKTARFRRNLVLDSMVSNHKLIKDSANFYKNEDIVVKDNYQYKSGYKYPYYFDQIIEEAIKKYNLTENQIMNGGYKIYTTLNQKYQTAMQTSFENSSYFPSNAPDGNKVQAASIALDPNTGGLLGIVGGREHVIFRGYNRATQLQRSPGSAIKPIAVYTPAVQNGYHYDSMLDDTLKQYGTNHYTPRNWNDEYQNQIPMYEALALSKNTSAVWLLNKIGVQKGYDEVRKFGIKVSKADENLSLALGGMTKGVSPYDMVNAYQIFANQGRKYPIHCIEKIIDSSGNLLIDNTRQDFKQVISKNTANEMTSMMIDVYQKGTGYTAKPNGYTIAGKTGSTQAFDPRSNLDTDRWYIGYTPDIVLATWLGFDSTNNKMENEGIKSGALLFKNQMQTILPNTRQTKFQVKSASQRIIDRNQNKIIKSSGNENDIWDKIKDGSSKFEIQISKQVDSAKNVVRNIWDNILKNRR